MNRRHDQPPKRLERQIRRAVTNKHPGAFRDCHQFLIHQCGYDCHEAYSFCEVLTGAYRLELMELNRRARRSDHK